MELKTINQEKEYDEIEKIYTEAFPDNERAPMKMLKKRAKKGKADFLAVYNNDKIIGMCYVVCYKDLAYLFYIAIDKNLRGKGYGRKTIAALLKRYSGKRFFLALEQLDKTADNYEQRVKRHEFYKSCGMCDLPFLLKEGTVTFAAMGHGFDNKDKTTVTPEEYKKLTDSYLGFFMKHMVDMRLLPKKTGKDF